MGMEGVKSGAFVLRFFQVRTSRCGHQGTLERRGGRCRAPLYRVVGRRGRWQRPHSMRRRQRRRQMVACAAAWQPTGASCLLAFLACPPGQPCPALASLPAPPDCPQMICAIVAFATVVDWDGLNRIKFVMFTGITGFILALFFMVAYAAGVGAVSLPPASQPS